jgi:hypothetical protein
MSVFSNCETGTPKLLDRTGPGLLKTRREAAGSLPTVEEFARAIVAAAANSQLPSGHISFGESRLPTLVQYDPCSRHLEVHQDTLVVSGDSGVPLVHSTRFSRQHLTGVALR